MSEIKSWNEDVLNASNTTASTGVKTATWSRTMINMTGSNIAIVKTACVYDLSEHDLCSRRSEMIRLKGIWLD